MPERIIDASPMRGRLIVKRLEASEKTDGGILKTQERTELETMWNEFADVVRIGDPEPGQKELDLQLGDRVLIQPNLGKNFYMLGKLYTVLPYTGVMLKFTVEQYEEEGKPLIILPPDAGKIALV